MAAYAKSYNPVSGYRPKKKDEEEGTKTPAPSLTREKWNLEEDLAWNAWDAINKYKFRENNGFHTRKAKLPTNVEGGGGVKAYSDYNPVEGYDPNRKKQKRNGKT